MSNTAIDFRAPSVARSTAQRVADGVVAGYIRSLAGRSPEPAERAGLTDQSEQTDQLGPLPARALDCEPCRTSWTNRAGTAARRHPARRRALLPA